MCYIRMLAGSPRDPLCHSVHIRESAGFTAGDQHHIRGESDLSQVLEERGLPQDEKDSKCWSASTQCAQAGDCPCTSTAALPTGAWCFQDRQPGGQGRGQAEQSQLRSGSPPRSLTSRAQRLSTDQAQLTAVSFLVSSPSVGLLSPFLTTGSPRPIEGDVLVRKE